MLLTELFFSSKCNRNLQELFLVKDLGLINSEDVEVKKKELIDKLYIVIEEYRYLKMKERYVVRGKRGLPTQVKGMY